MTKQTDDQDVDGRDLLGQAEAVFKHYDARLAVGDTPVKAVHFSFMARGEPLASEHFLAGGDRIMQMLAELAVQRRLIPRFLVSTILPRSLRVSLQDVHGSLAAKFRLTQPFIYYSIYSVRSEFRDVWLPKALPVHEALTMLKQYQDETGRMPRLHWPLIKGENDDPTDVKAIADVVDAAGLRVDVNLVRYNPPDGRGEEAPESAYQNTANVLRHHWPFSRVKVVPRVGYDVYASCGCFSPPA